MPIRLASRLHLNRFGIYGFRLVIPKHMRVLFSQYEYRYSLKTSDKIRAKYLAFHLGNLVRTHFERISQSVNFEQAVNNAQQLLKSLGVDSTVKHTNFLEQLCENVDGTDKERLMRLLELRKRSSKIEQEKLSMLKQYTLAISNCSESEVDSITCDFYAELTPIKNEESILSQQFHEISTELQGLIYERIHTNNVEQINETFNKDKENLAGFVSQIIAKSAVITPQSTSSNQTNGFNTQTSEKLLSEVIQEYCENQKAESKWTLKSESTVNAVFVLWLRIVGDQPIASYGFVHHRSYKSILQKLPPNINKSPKYLGKTIEQIIALNEKPSATHTTNNSLTRISGLFEWAIKYGFVTFNPAKGMTIKNPKRANEERKAFSDADLKKLFCSDIYVRKTFKHSYHFWLPLLALYTSV